MIITYWGLRTCCALLSGGFLYVHFSPHHPCFLIFTTVVFLHLCRTPEKLTDENLNDIGSLCKSSGVHLSIGRCHALVVIAGIPAWHLPALGLCWHAVLSLLMTIAKICGYAGLAIMTYALTGLWECTPDTFFTHWRFYIVGVHAWHILPTSCFTLWVCTPGPSYPLADTVWVCTPGTFALVHCWAVRMEIAHSWWWLCSPGIYNATSWMCSSESQTLAGYLFLLFGGVHFYKYLP